MNHLNRLFLFLSLVFFAGQVYGQEQVIVQGMLVSFEGKPVRTMCESALGQITSYKYSSYGKDSIISYICEVSVYKNVKTDDNIKDNDYLNYIIASEEMSALKANGKILEKKDSTFKELPAKLYKIYFEREGNYNNSLYFEKNGLVFKLSTSIPDKVEDTVSKTFFSSQTVK
jgi:hypothetical protein